MPAEHRQGWQGRNVTTSAATLYILCTSISADFHRGRRSENMADSSSSRPWGDHHKLESPRKSNGLGSALCCESCFDAASDGDEEEGSLGTLQKGEAFDIVMVENHEGRLFQNSNFLVSFSNNLRDGQNQQQRIVLEIENINHQNHSAHANLAPDNAKAWFPIVHTKNPVSEEGDNSKDSFDEERFWGCCHPSSGNAVPGRLSSLNGSIASEESDPTSGLRPYLQVGRNPIRYLLLDDNRVVGVALANIYLWKHTDSIVVSDIDGTITKSNVRGLIDTVMTDTYRHCHEGICNLLTQLASQQHPTIDTRIVYVTSRLLGLANHTRNLLNDLRQGGSRLPEGPVLGFGGSLSQLMVMEVVSKSTHHFKSEMLWRQVVQPFRNARKPGGRRPNDQGNGNANATTTELFVAGFGNSWMDVQAYHSVGIRLSRIFKISEDSQIVTFDKYQKGGDPGGEKCGDKRPPATETVALTMSDQDDSTGVFHFPPKRWYKDRRGSAFAGYADPRLIATVIP